MSNRDHPATASERIADVHHQIVGDLTVIRAQSQLLRRRCRAGQTIQPDDLCERLEQVEELAMRIAQAVDRLATEQSKL